MNKLELLEKINGLDCGDVSVMIRGEHCVGSISDVYIDTDHSDDSEFISIDLENEI